MKIGLISDTHLRETNPELTDLLSGPFRDVEMILHAGDITELAVLGGLGGKKVHAVWGNMDSAAVRQTLPPKRIIQVGKMRIGLIHGWGGPQGIAERVAGEFRGVNGIVFGHTHTPGQSSRGGILLFNPGSFGAGWTQGKRSVGILQVSDQISGEIVWL